jgi:hypothetical protein
VYHVIFIIVDFALSLSRTLIDRKVFKLYNYKRIDNIYSSYLQYILCGCYILSNTHTCSMHASKHSYTSTFTYSFITVTWKPSKYHSLLHMTDYTNITSNTIIYKFNLKDIFILKNIYYICFKRIRAWCFFISYIIL